jgi:hypothetical protein
MDFPTTYAEARQRFRHLAAQAGATLEAHPLTARGPDGEPLTIDVARGGAGADVLIVTGGLHGAEAPLGAALQCAILEQGPPAGVRWVLVPALNPWGFAHVRRANEDNVDLNRNFLPAGAAYAGCPAGYRQLDALLNPPRPPRRGEPFLPRAVLAILRHGWGPIKQAVAGGQHEFPRGLFYAGAGPAEATRIIQAQWPGWLGGARRSLHLDVHSGLGKWAHYKLLVSRPLTVAQEAWLGPYLGDRLELSRPEGTAYATAGDLNGWCVANAGATPCASLCAEFGTYGPLTVVAALRAENQAHHWGRPGDAATMRAKLRLQEVFVPASAAWRRRVLTAGVDLIRQAAAALEARPG